MSEIVFELCAETMASCLAARTGGAHRIELCSSLDQGGLTPDDALIAAAVQRSGLPVYAMLRPRGGDFVYTAAEFAVMETQLYHAKSLGVAGFVAGILLPQGGVDLPRMRRLVALADGLEVTFHRAFDTLLQHVDLSTALEQVIATGCHRLLTSGGAPDVFTGAQVLHQLGVQAAGRIVVAAGGGLRMASVAQVAGQTGLRHFHGSVRRAGDSEAVAEDIRALVDALRCGAGLPPIDS